MLRIKTVGCCFAAAMIFAITAFADNDPALWEDGTHCAPGTFWCASVTFGADPHTGYSTQEFIMNNPSSTNPQEGYSSWNDTGIVAFTTNGLSTGTVEDLLDFQNIGGQAVIFLYCGNENCVSDDLGLPASYTVNAYAEFGSMYIPQSGQAGYSTNAYADGVAAGTTQYPFGIIDTNANLNGTNRIAVLTPEPSGILLLSSMFFLVSGAAIRSKMRSRT